MKYQFLVLTGLLFLVPFFSFGQVTIAPTNLFIDGNARFGTYMVINGSNETQEISVELLFGYSTTDENGKRINVVNDSTLAPKYSIAESVKAFPKNFTLAPNQRQIVRLRIVPPSNIEDGTYWARIKTTSSSQTPPLELQANDAVAARVGIKLEQLTGLFFKFGEVSTGIDLGDINTTISDDKTHLDASISLTRTGNSPFLGSISSKLLDDNSNVVAQNFVSTSLYFDKVFTQSLDISNVPPGNYSLMVTFETKRSDIPVEDIIQMQPVSKTTSVIIR